MRGLADVKRAGFSAQSSRARRPIGLGAAKPGVRTQSMPPARVGLPRPKPWTKQESAPSEKWAMPRSAGAPSGSAATFRYWSSVTRRISATLVTPLKTFAQPSSRSVFMPFEREMC